MAAARPCGCPKPSGFRVRRFSLSSMGMKSCSARSPLAGSSLLRRSPGTLPKISRVRGSSGASAPALRARTPNPGGLNHGCGPHFCARLQRLHSHPAEQGWSGHTARSRQNRYSCGRRGGTVDRSEEEPDHASVPVRQTSGFLDLFAVLEFDLNAALHYAEIRAGLESAGRSIGPLDLLIAAQPRSLDATLVTGNAAEFKRVKGLKVREWHPA
jgi:hypothetical protein